MRTEEQKRKQSEAMKARWADPEFRRKLKKTRKARMATKKPQAPEDVFGTWTVGTCEQISVSLPDLKATHRFSSIVGVSDASWINQTIPVPMSFRIAHVILEPIK